MAFCRFLVSGVFRQNEGRDVCRCACLSLMFRCKLILARLCMRTTILFVLVEFEGKLSV